ncbi:MAG: peptide chain release factor 2 [Desulfovibrio sp.]|nr:peptide chain release factor 2 [Desulfovibrio sp.]MBQ2515725.1 peptide chain release factor 2 [Desulfovibrio sp.]MCR5168894.1 peptide chain release factor 2 [Desulfovibrio sp.]
MLQLSDLRPRCQALDGRFSTLWGRLDSEGDAKRLADIEKDLAKPDAWGNPEALTPVLQEKSRIEGNLARYKELKDCRDDMAAFLELAEESEGDELQELLESLAEQLDLLEQRLDDTEMVTLLGDEEDAKNAILEIHPGAGGTEAQDWAEMLLRLYTRWAARRGFKCEEMDYLPGEEAGVKRVTLRLIGPYAFGQLRSERGIHRLIRISPFDNSGRRHTSFASVDVIPDVGNEIKLDVKESDLRIDTFRSSGPGGQGVNTTTSAVRITHLPTGITAQCQNERSQHHNKDSAMRILMGRLYNLELEKRDAERQATYDSKDAIAFGSQIRTYTLQPFRLVKDHRTGCEGTDTDAILDGDIDKFQHAFLLWRFAKLHAQGAR